MSAIHQFVAGFATGDAISNEAVAMRRIFRSWGFESDIFCETRRILPELRREAYDLEHYAGVAKPEDIALLHLSIGSPANDCFARLPCRKVILYHNFTPAEYFELINPQTAALLSKAIPQIKALAGTAQVNLADSSFNAAELTELGFRDVCVFPLMVDFSQYEGEPDSRVTRRFDDGRTNILFVSRGAPNKKIDDALRAFYCFHRTVTPFSRFIHVGSFAGTERYHHLLMAQMKALDLSDDDVHLAGPVTQTQLNAFYRVADAFLCMSEHEGFCVPVLEAMFHGVPVLARDAGAVSETMGDAGVLIRERNFGAIAEMLGHVTKDTAFREAILAAQRARLQRYRERDLDRELREHLAPLLPTA